MYVWVVLILGWMLIVWFSIYKATSVIDVVFRNELHATYGTLKAVSRALRQRRGRGRRLDRLERVVADAGRRKNGCVAFQQLLFLIGVFGFYFWWRRYLNHQDDLLLTATALMLLLSLAGSWWAFVSEHNRILTEYKSASRSRAGIGSKLQLDDRTLEDLQPQGASRQSHDRFARQMQFTRREMTIFLRLNLSSLRDEIQANNADFRLSRSICNATIQRFERYPRNLAMRTAITEACGRNFVTPLRAWINRVKRRHPMSLGKLEPWAVLTAVVNGHDDWSSNGTSFEGGDLWDEVWEELEDVECGAARGAERRAAQRDRSSGAYHVKIELPPAAAENPPHVAPEVVTGVLVDKSRTGFSAVVSLVDWRQAIKRRQAPRTRAPELEPILHLDARPDHRAHYASLCWFRARPLRIGPHYLVRGELADAP